MAFTSTKACDSSITLLPWCPFVLIYTARLSLQAGRSTHQEFKVLTYQFEIPSDAGGTKDLCVRCPSRHGFDRPGRANLPGGCQGSKAMVDRFTMEIHQAAIHRRANCCKKRESENPISEQCPEQEAVEHPRRQVQGMYSTDEECCSCVLISLTEG